MGPNSCPTVAIQGEPSEGNPSGIVVINEEDFDEATMTKAAMPEQQQQVEQPPAPPAPETDPNAAKIVAPWAAK